MPKTAPHSTRVPEPANWCAALVFLAQLPVIAGAQPATNPATAPAPASQPASRPAPAAPRTLFAHGTADRFWIARVETRNESGRTVQQTVVREQKLPGDQWREVTTIGAPILGLSNLQGDAVVLLEDGAWRRLNTTMSTGLTIPGIGPTLAFARAPGALYAIRDYEGGRAGALDDEDADPAAPAPSPPPVTRPANPPGGATRPATRSAAPTTAPSPVLFRYERSQWRAVADLPPRSAAPLALGALGEKPVLVVRSADPARLQTFVWTGGQWDDTGAIPVAPGSAFSLAQVPNAVALWVSAPSGEMWVVTRADGQKWSDPKALKAASTAGDVRAFTSAGEEFRLVVARDPKLFEQRFGFDGAARTPLVELPAATSGQPGNAAWLFQTFIVAGMVVVILLTVYRRRQEQQTPPEKPE
ncbi:MAG TPA: hypothetical protein VEA69_18045 [Tepidisphaeraceae bacterium]|nr:hypothetical protein [Tepidisphaeraceae bacterium]